MNNSPGRPKIDSNDYTVVMTFKIPSKILTEFRSRCHDEGIVVGKVIRKLIRNYVQGDYFGPSDGD